MDLPSFFRHAKRMALESDQEHRLGACVVKSGRVLSVGKNAVNKTNWVTRRFFEYPTVHAECSALARLSPENIRGATLYIYREKWTGVPGLAKPCPRCAEAIAENGITKVVYTTNEAPFYAYWYPQRELIAA